MDNIMTYTLPCGMRCIFRQEHTAGVYMGVAVACGTRHELPNESGMAHFTEHMSFKGTERRTAMQIINRLEGVGGELNAYTGKEETVYYASVEPSHVSRAVDLLLDIVFHSTYPQHEMQKEVEVVCDEIESYNDSPAELIFDDFEACVFGKDMPLGRSILGDAGILRQHMSADMAAFARRGYRPGQACFFVCGNVDAKRVLRMLEKAMERYPALPYDAGCQTAIVNPAVPLPADGREIVMHKNVHQAHVMIGTRTVGMSHPDRLALQLLNNILGGPGLNSRLNLALRERSGLVYTVESCYTGYTDTGVWSMYFGCDQQDVKRCRRLALKELDRLCQSPMSLSALNAAKRQMLGQLALGYDQHESVAIAMGKSFLHYNRYRSEQQIAAGLMAVTAEDLHRVACTVFSPEGLTTLMYV